MPEEWTIEQIKLAMARRSVLLRIYRSPNPGQELADWIRRGGSAEVIPLRKTDPSPERRLDAGGS